MVSTFTVSVVLATPTGVVRTPVLQQVHTLHTPHTSQPPLPLPLPLSPPALLLLLPHPNMTASFVSDSDACVA